MHQWREVQEAWDRSPYSEDVRKRKAQVDELFKDFVKTFKACFSLRPVRQERMFLPVSRFFQRQYPIRDPFSILHCDVEIPLHTVHDFHDHHALARINAALAKDAPFPWWQRGTYGQPCYLFGEWVWELKPSEVGQSSEGLVLSFLELSDKHRQATDPASYGPSVTGVTSGADFIPENLRVLAWRRTGGKCGKCRGRQSLHFDYVKPLRPGVEPTPDSIELLCNSCYRKKHDLD